MPAFHFILAVVWIVAGVVILALQILGDDPRFRVRALGDFSLGWVALLLGGYNLVRWYGARAALRARALAREEEAKRRALHRGGRDRDEEPGSGFTLTDEPLPPHGGGGAPGGGPSPSGNGDGPAT